MEQDSVLRAMKVMGRGVLRRSCKDLLRGHSRKNCGLDFMASYRLYDIEVIDLCTDRGCDARRGDESNQGWPLNPTISPILLDTSLCCYGVFTGC